MAAPTRPELEPADARAEAIWRWLQRVVRALFQTNGVAAATTLTSVNGVVRADATAGAFAVTLPAASAVAGQTFWIKKVDASANAVTVTAAGTDLIDGAATYPLAVQYQSVTVRSFGTGWDIL